MSRIHEALRKAEEQRLANLGQPSEPAEEPAFSGKFGAAVVAESSAAISPVSEATEATEPIQSASLRIDAEPQDRLANCTKKVWSPSKDALFLAASDSHAPGLEEFRSLRAKLFQIRAKRPLKTVLISSALPGEGKSFVSANLAQAFARQRGGRTLLIDADLRKPHMHEVLGAASGPGLYEYLTGTAREFEIVQRSQYEELFFVPGGNVTSTSAELIGNGRIKTFLEQMSPLFSWIVIDSSPVIPVSDATRLAENCDGVLLVIQAGSTSQEMAERAKSEFHDSPLLGVVLNQVTRKENPYYRYRYDKYGKRATYAND